eukprot:m.41030 g.41030  ORF g.41030 m.41030 type:complete len:246 (-) comp12799_c0_seq8:27-764(-)
MDKFVVRTKRPKQERCRKTYHNSATKQSTIGSLKGVISLKDGSLLKEAYRATPQDTEAIIGCLSRLEEKNVTLQLMKKLGVGKIIKRLQTSSNAEVAERAKRIVATWTATILKPKAKSQEVRRGGEDEKGRQYYQQSYIAALSRETKPLDEAEVGARCLRDRFDEDESDVACLARHLDNAVFATDTERRLSDAYRRQSRRLASYLRTSSKLRLKLWQGVLEPEELAALSRDKRRSELHQAAMVNV